MRILELIQVTSWTTLDSVLPNVITYLSSLSPETTVDLFFDKNQTPFRTKAFTKSVLLLQAVDSISILSDRSKVTNALSELRLVLNGLPVKMVLLILTR
jgi:hypothetical protein